MTYQYPYLSTISTHWYEYGLVSTLMRCVAIHSQGIDSHADVKPQIDAYRFVMHIHLICHAYSFVAHRLHHLRVHAYS